MIYKELDEYLKLLKKNENLFYFFSLDYSFFAYKIAEEMILNGVETMNDFKEQAKYVYEAFVEDKGYMLPIIHKNNVISFAYKLWHECMDNEKEMDPYDFLKKTYGWLG